MRKQYVSVTRIVTIVLVTISTLLLAIVGTLNYQSTKRTKLARLHDELAVTASQLSTGLAISVWNVDDSQSDKIIESAMLSRSVYGVVLVSEGNRRAYCRDKRWNIAMTEPGLTGNDLISAMKQIRFRDRVLGTVTVYVTTRFIGEELTYTLISTVIVILLLDASLILLLYLFLNHIVLAPLKQVEQFAVSVSSGAKVQSLGDASFYGELDSLRRSIEEMYTLLHSRYVALLASEQSLRLSEEKYRDLVEYANSVILRMTPSGEITFFNEYAEKLLGFTRNEIVGKNIIGTIIQSHQEVTESAGLKMLHPEHPEEYIHSESPVMDKNGKEIWISWSNRPVYDGDGKLMELLCVGQDISERRLLEQQVTQQQKLEGIGLLAGGIAHDFNNLLLPIFGYSEMIINLADEQSKIQNYASSVIVAANKAKDLIKQLLTFSRKQLLATGTYDINEIVASFMTILQRTIRENIEIVQKLCPEACMVSGDRTQLEQILLNMAVNAQDAIAGNGRITIETGHTILDAEYCAMYPGTAPGHYILLAFSDTGCGMNEATISHIFDPFYTTKPVGSGTGLGLSTVYGIINQHNGLITVQSKPGNGTSFFIYLPAYSGEVDVKASSSAPPDISKLTTGSVLLVEDNQMVMDMMKELLENRGLTVFAAGRPEDALRIAEENWEDIALLVSDIIMPVMNGPELYGNLLKIIPDLKVLFMSGYAENTAVHSGDTYKNASYIKKPFTTEEFFNRARELL